MLKGVIVILLFQLLGETLVALLQSPVPGPVAGMILLWLGLAIKGGPSKDLSVVSHNLIQYLSLFFLPAGVGLFFLPPELHQYLPALISAMVAGTLVAMLLSGWLLKSLARNTDSTQTRTQARNPARNPADH
ncbi:MAG: CidA/LrgA family protein [Gammaproteobacteria bacterium]|nr:CidA/LrgA family protein [Gammaproteobacteria bacterium]